MADGQDTLKIVIDSKNHVETITDGRGDRIVVPDSGKENGTVTMAGQQQPHSVPGAVIAEALNGLITHITPANMDPQQQSADTAVFNNVPAAPGFIQNLYNQGR